MVIFDSWILGDWAGRGRALFTGWSVAGSAGWDGPKGEWTYRWRLCGGSAAPIAPVIGTVDMDAVFKGYEKFKASNKDFQAAVLARQNELMKLKAEGDEESQMLAKLNPGTQDFKNHENRFTELKARLAAGKEQAQREFQLRESENVATIYKEVQLMVTAIAQWRKMNYVVRVTNLQPAGADPNSVMAALQNTMIYFDPRNDITNDVIFNLNRRYKAVANTPAPAATNSVPSPPPLNNRLPTPRSPTRTDPSSSAMNSRGRECSKPSAGSARLPIGTEVRGQGFFRGSTSLFAFGRPSPARASSSNGQTCPVIRGCLLGSIE